MKLLTIETITFGSMVLSYIWLLKLIYENESTGWFYFSLIFVGAMVYVISVLDIKKYWVPLLINVTAIIIYCGKTT